MSTITLSIAARDSGEVLLEDFDVVLPVEFGREAETDYLGFTSGDGRSFALQWRSPEISRKHCCIMGAGSGDAWLQDTSTNGVTHLSGPNEAPVDRKTGLDLRAGQTTTVFIPGLRLDIRVQGHAASAPPPEPADPGPPPPPPLPPAQLAPGPVLTLALDGSDDVTHLHDSAVILSTGTGGLSLRPYPMARTADLLAQPQRPGRSTAAAIGADDAGALVLAVVEGGAPVKVNRGVVTGGTRPLSALDTIEIEGAVLRIAEPGQRVLVCQNCNMSNAYEHSGNCPHCGTRLINAATRLLHMPKGGQGQ